MTDRLTDEQREALAVVLENHMTERDFEQGCAFRCGYDGDDRDHHLADVIAPVVAQMLADARAEALREAADAWETDVSDPTPRSGAHADAWLRRRADSLDATEEQP